MTLSFAIFQILKFVMLFGIAVGTGVLARDKMIKVNYTRKINHFAISFLPELLYKAIHYEMNNYTVAVGALISLGYFVFFARPVRTRVKAFEIAFYAIDRPEDRPHTLFWFVTQFAAGIMIIVPFYLYFAHSHNYKLAYIPLLINGLGDGLAEPVGVRFGRHFYNTRALFGTKMYVRTWEGSACVFLSAIIILLCFRELFSTAQLAVSLIVLPISATLAEAFSPHTWDAPFILLVCSLTLVGVKLI